MTDVQPSLRHSQPSPARWGRRLLGQPVARLLVASLTLAATLVVGIMAWALHRAAWDNAWREIREKHQLLAQNLAAPISGYMEGQRMRLALLAHMVGAAGNEEARDMLAAAQALAPGWVSVSLLDPRDRIVATTEPRVRLGTRLQAADGSCLARVRRGDAACLSGVQPNPFRRAPTALLAVPVPTRGPGWVLAAMLDLGPIEALRRRIRFGERGHSAIVDQHGRVVAHPNPAWMAEMKDISAWPIVQAMMAGRTGVMSFYSPFVGAEMVAGYASVPGLGWGVMVPQPKSEVARQVAELTHPVLAGGLVAVAAVALIGMALARWISRPITRLATDVQKAMASGFTLPPPDPGPHAPREVRQLAAAFAALLADLRAERARHEALRSELESRVRDATRELREANAQLERLARLDHLTTLANRRHFEEALARVVGRRSSDTTPLCLLLLDVDRFKEINDSHGHAAGDAVLRQIATLLRRHTRAEDLVARYGGDEFAVLMRCNARDGETRAREMLRAIAGHRFEWRGRPIPVTVSIGMATWEGGASGYDPDELLRRADRAMYEAKALGRNTLWVAPPAP